MSRSQRAGHVDCCFLASANKIILFVGLAALIERGRVLAEVINISVGPPPPLLWELVSAFVTFVRLLSLASDVAELTEVLRVGFLGLGGRLGDLVTLRKSRNSARAVLNFPRNGSIKDIGKGLEERR